MKTDNLVSIIVLTYNSKNFINKCLESVANQEYNNFELIIVDNNSTDGTKQKLSEINLTKNIPTRVILNSENLGYNLGNKVGIENSEGDFIALVNPDVQLDKFWLKNMMIFLENNAEIVSASGRFLNSKGEVESTGGIIDTFGAVRQRKIDEEDSKNFFYNPGAAVIFRKNLFDKLSLDPNLFMYYDDVDFAWQIRLLNYKIGYCKKANAIHLGGQSSELYPSKYYHIVKNRLYICTKNYSRKNIIKQIFQIEFLLFLDSIYYSIKLRSFKYFLALLKAWTWNIINFKKLILERKKIQRQRTVSDHQLEKFMQKNSIEKNILKKILTH